MGDFALLAAVTRPDPVALSAVSILTDLVESESASSHTPGRLPSAFVVGTRCKRCGSGCPPRSCPFQQPLERPAAISMSQGYSSDVQVSGRLRLVIERLLNITEPTCENRRMATYSSFPAVGVRVKCAKLGGRDT